MSMSWTKWPSIPPCAALQGLPRNGSPGTVTLYAAVLLAFALLKAWPGEAASSGSFFGESAPLQLASWSIGG